MKAAVGDRLVIKGHNVGDVDRGAEILEIHGEDGGAPYLVRWSDDGREGLANVAEGPRRQHAHERRHRRPIAASVDR